uniref:Uncharacterized protein n=2 Tax=Ciona intestinalis TaxID=7719 RepID=F6WFQ9_CIOIN
MGSSFEKEMPTNDGVFGSTVKQPFMNNTVKKPLKELRKAIQETTVDTESSDEESVASDVEDTPEPEPENIPLSDRGRESNRVTFENVALASGGAIASGLVSNIVGWYVFIVIAIIAFVVWAVEVQGTDRVIVMLFFALCGAAYILPSQVFCFLLGELFGIFWPNLPDWWRS